MTDFLPSFDPYLDAAAQQGGGGPAPTPVAPQGPAATGTGNWFTSGLQSGVYNTLSEAGSAGEAVARAVGADHVADQAKAFSDAQHATAQTYANPEIENDPWYSPRAIAYRTAQSLPMLAGGVLGAGIAAAAAPESAVAGVFGGAAAMLPSTIGGNVQRKEGYTDRSINQKEALEAIGLGVPEAAIQGLLPGQLEGGLLKGVGGGIGGAVTKGAITQAAAGAAQEWATQQMGDPNRTFAQRAQDVVTAALQGGVLGGVATGLLHPLSPAHEIAKTPAQDVTGDDAKRVIDASLSPPAPMAKPVAAPGDVFAAQTAAAEAAGGQFPIPPSQPDLTAQRAARPVSRFSGTLDQRLITTAARGGSEAQGPQPQAPLYDGLTNPPGEFPDPTSFNGTRPMPPAAAGPEAPYDWAADRKALQQAKAYSPIVKGPFASRDELVSTVAQNVAYRLANGDAFEDIPKSLQNAAKKLNLVGEDGTLSPQITGAADATARPPGITPDDDGAAPQSGPQIPDRLAREEIKLKQQGRWDQLEQVRQKLLGDNLTDPQVMDLMKRTTDAQNALNTPTKNWRGQANLIASLRAAVDARAADAKAPPASQPAAEANAPAAGPDPTAAAQATIAAAKPPADAPAQPQTKEAAAKAKRSGKPAPASAPVPDAPAPTPAEPVPPATMKDVQARQLDAAAPPATTPDELAAQQPIPSRFAPPARTPEEQAAYDSMTAAQRPIERDARYWEYLRTAYPEDIEARAQQAEHLDEATKQLAQPKAKDDATAADLNVAVDQARQAGAVREALGADQPQTREQRAKAARQAMLDNRDPPPERGSIDDQHSPEVVRPRLAKSIDDVPEGRTRPATPEERQVNEGDGVPLVDPSTASGFARQGKVSQADARRTAMNNGLRARLAMIESGKRPITPVPESVLRNLDNAKAQAEALIRQGAIIPRNMDFPNKDARFQDLLGQHYEQLELADRAARMGGMEGLREIPRDYFGTDLFDEMSGHVTPQTERNLESHAISESRIQDAAALARGERPLIKYSAPPTTFDNDLRNIVERTGDMKAALAHIRDNSSDVNEKALANRLLEGGAGGTVSMSDGVPPVSHEIRPGEMVAGYHYADRNHTDIYDGGGMSQTLMHEAAHSATLRALRAGGPAAKEINAIYDKVKANSPDEDAYGLKNASELVAEAYSNPQFQQFLKSLPSENRNMWERFKDAVKSIFGVQGRSMLDDVMDTTNRLMGENVREASTNVNVQAQRAGQAYFDGADQAGSALIRKVQEELDNKGTKLAMRGRDTALGLMTGDHIAWSIKDRIKSALGFMTLQNQRTVRTDILGSHLMKALDGLKNFEPKGRDAATRLMQRTIQNIDPRRSWKDHTWLKGDPQEAILQQEHAKAVKDYDILRRMPGGAEMFDQLIDANEASRHLKSLFHMYDFQQREYPTEQWGGGGYVSDPIRDYEANTALHDSPKLAKSWAEQREAQMLTGLKAKQVDIAQEINTLTTKQQGNAKLPVSLQMTVEQAQELQTQITQAKGNLDAARGLSNDIGAMNKRAAQGPYFHLGREGDHFVTGRVRTSNNIPDDAALQTIRDRMDKAGFHDAVISRGTDNPSIYVRLEGQAQRENLYGLFNQMHDEGLFDQKTKIARGVAADTSIYSSVGPQWMRQAIEALKNSPPEIPVNATASQKTSLEAAHAQMVREQTRSLMDMLPDTSITKLYSKRENVQGFNSNMVDSYKASSISNARGLSNMSLARELGQASTRMNDELESLNADRSVTGSALTATSQAMGELILRNKLYQAHVPSTFMDGLRKMVHTFQIGASPAYFFTLMSQIPTLTLPELAKTHGYVRSSAAMAKSTTQAFQIMRAVWSDGKGGMSMGNEALAFGMRREALERYGIDPKTVDFLMSLNARGAFNQGAYTEAMTGHGGEGLLTTASKYANVMGRYSEQFPRILTALAARDLHTSQPAKALGLSAEDFAHQSVMNSQFNWNPELNARQTTRSGMFGAMSPLINQFMGFQIRMTEKLYREVATGFGSGTRGTAEGKMARTWLYGHAAAVTMLAGTLGAPLVSVAASVFDRLADMATGKDDYDITASYRSWLAGQFGKEYGEAIARGLPRLAGMDFDHLGEGKIVPGSNLLMMMTEKRKMEDADKDWLKSMAGSSMGFIFNAKAAGRDFMNGDYMDSMIKVAPELLKGPTEAYRLEKRGFVDKRGNKLPITANAADVMMTAMGIDPAKEAEYDEEKKVATGLQQMRNVRSQNITRHLILASNRGDDMANFKQWQQEAIQFGKDHPGLQNPMTDFGRSLDTYARQAAFSRGFGSPIGVQPRDIVGRGMTSFGNLRNGEQ